jgi:hypothetical protein
VAPTDGVVFPLETRVSLVSDGRVDVKSRLAVFAGVRSGEDDRQGERCARKPDSTASRCNFSKLDETKTWKALIRRFKVQANYVIRKLLVRDDKHVHGITSIARAATMGYFVARLQAILVSSSVSRIRRIVEFTKVRTRVPVKFSGIQWFTLV